MNWLLKQTFTYILCLYNVNTLPMVQTLRMHYAIDYKSSHFMSYFSFINLKYFQYLDAIEDFWTDYSSKLSHIFCAYTMLTHYLWCKHWECIMQSIIKSSQNELTSCICMEPFNASKMHSFSMCVVVHATTSWTSSRGLDMLLDGIHSCYIAKTRCL